MHRSRLHVVVIDSAPEHAEQEIAFWVAALGGSATPEEGTPFSVLSTLEGGELLAHQRLGEGTSRIHLDIETDDTEAEVGRLEALGAARVGEHGGCVQLRDPAGLVFCVLPIQSKDFAEHATTWD